MRVRWLSGAAGVVFAAVSAAPQEAVAPEPLVEYRARADPQRRISVEVRWPSGLRPRIPRDDSGSLGAAAVTPTGKRRLPAAESPEWQRDCAAAGCVIEYAVDPTRGAEADRRGERGFELKNGVLLAPLTRWLPRPEERPARGRFSLTFEGGAGFEMVSGFLDGATNRVDGDLVALDGPQVALGSFEHRTFTLPGARFDVAVSRTATHLRTADLVEWIRESAQNVAAIWDGRFPVPRVQVIVAGGGPYGIGSAVSMGMGGASVFVVVGDRAKRADLAKDWVMTHEMLHMVFPNMGFRQRWMEEGLSVFLEPLLRARRGRHDPDQVWLEWTRAMPQGLPREGDLGLDRTPTWARRYWGGALFWLHVDLEIRKRTDGAKSLDDVIREAALGGGTIVARWDLARLFAVAEQATGTTALRETYEAWSLAPVSPDLAALWASLGVRVEGRDRVRYDDHAPLAGARRGLLTAPRAGARRGASR